ncbi:DsrE family protein [Fusobacterium polymorphum]|uniref:DsrE family protein n=1 Tax=Fusobacterium nucleatum subsp. polymorphum TaxID=76857 RepID=UPI00300A2022
MLNKENCFILEIEDIFDRKILEEANNISFVCTSLAIGSDRQLGKVLLETYIYTLSELEILPKNIFLLNEAVLLTLPVSDCCLYLKRLQDRGVEILVCDTSATYYGIVKNMQVGKLIGMKTIIEKQLGATKLINIS